MMFITTLISTLVLLSVLLFVNRIFNQLKKQHLLSEKNLTKIGTIFVVFVFSVYIFCFSNPLRLWFYLVGSLFVFPVTLYFLTKIYQHQFYGDFVRFLSMLILKMQIGHSFKSAMDLTISGGSWKQSSLLQHIYENVAFTQQEPLAISGPFARFIAEIVEEFTRIQNNQHQAIDRLCKFQKKIQSSLFFRRKSRQIWSYFVYQLGLLTGIYLLILGYILKNYGWFGFEKVLSLSLSLYLLGCFSVYILWGAKKWDI